MRLSGTCSNITVKNLSITGSGLTADQHKGIWCSSGQTLTNIKITGNTINNTTIGVTLSADGSGSLNGILYAGNTIDTVVGTAGGYGYGLHIGTSQATGAGIRITGNRITNAQRHSIYHAKGIGSVIEGNTISGHRSTVADGSVLPAIMCLRSAMCTITGNTITEPSDGAICIGGPTTTGTASYGHVVTGNTITGPLNATQLITIGQLNPVAPPTGDGYPAVILVSGNTIYTTQAGQTCIYVYNGQQITIADNQMYLGSTSGSANRGIWLTGAGDTAGTRNYSDDITVRGNRFSSARVGNVPLSLVGVDQSTAAVTLDNNIAPLLSPMAGRVTSMFLVSGSPFVTDPNITVGRQDLSGLTLGSGNSLLNADLQLPLAGGTMAGVIAMGAHKITGLANGSAAADVPAFSQVPATPSAGNFGMTAWACDPAALNGSTALVAATHYAIKVYVTGSKTVSNVLLWHGLTGSGVSNAYFSLYNSAGNLLAGTQSADVSATWNATAGNKTFALGATSTVTDDFVYVSMWLNAASTTLPKAGTAGASNFGLSLGTSTGTASATSPRWGTAANAYTSSGTVAPSSLGTITLVSACWVIGLN